LSSVKLKPGRGCESHHHQFYALPARLEKEGNMTGNSISNYLRNLFFVHMIIMIILGASIWLIPGRTLLFVNWVPRLRPVTADLSLPGTMFFDAFLARILGAALLALAFSSFRGWRAQEWREVEVLVLLEGIFCALGALGILYHAARTDVQPRVIHWLALILLVVFALAWGLALRRGANKL
jgi:hypothetical protein